jgi:hypothetical protein
MHFTVPLGILDVIAFSNNIACDDRWMYQPQQCEFYSVVGDTEISII